MPEKINWPLLIKLLRKTYTHGDGGLPAESGISKVTISECCKRGVHSLKNARTLWAIAMRRLTEEQRQSCAVDTYMEK